MSIKSKLDFISKCNDFKVTIDDDGFYKVTLKGGENFGFPLVAFIDHEGNIEYTVGGIYNSGCDYATIDMKALEELKSFCEMLVKEN